MNPEAPKQRETPKEPDWNALIRNSFLFSQGSTDLQDAILKWLALGSLRSSYDPKPHDEDPYAVNSVDRFAAALESKKMHLKDIDVDGNASSWLRKLRSHIAIAASSGLDTELERSKVMRDVARLVQIQDYDWTVNTLGRPIPSGTARDRYSSFIIDFGILKQGDGYFTWNGLPEEYKKMWEAVIATLKTDSSNPELIAIRDKYLERHPGLSEKKRQKIVEFFNS